MPRMDLLLSPGYSLTLWSQPDTGFQHVTISTPMTLELPVSGYYGCRGRIPFHHLPQNVEPYLVKCRHLVVHPWVTVFVDGVEGQPTQCGTDQDQPESHQVDVEGPAPTHMETPCKNSISQKTLPSKEAPTPAPRRPPVSDCLLARESPYESQHLTWSEITFLKVQMILLVLVSQRGHLSPDNGDDGTDTAIPTFHPVCELCIASSRPEDALSPCHTP